jgi:hypothetical protein
MRTLVLCLLLIAAPTVANEDWGGSRVFGPEKDFDTRNHYVSALTIRDYIAIQMMAAMMSQYSTGSNGSRRKLMAENAYEAADALIAARREQ